MQPNSYAVERNHIPHDPDEKDRELDLDVERYIPNSEDLEVGMVLLFSEKRLRLLLSNARFAALGPDLTPWIGWAEIKQSELYLRMEHKQQSILQIVVRFQHSGQALSLPIRIGTPWVAKK